MNHEMHFDKVKPNTGALDMRSLLERRKAAAIANGEEWIDPEELARREQEEIAREHEANRIADLKARCEKKGLDFETENAKYLKKQAEKAAKKK